MTNASQMMITFTEDENMVNSYANRRDKTRGSGNGKDSQKLRCLQCRCSEVVAALRHEWQNCSDSVDHRVTLAAATSPPSPLTPPQQITAFSNEELC